MCVRQRLPVVRKRSEGCVSAQITAQGLQPKRGKQMSKITDAAPATVPPQTADLAVKFRRLFQVGPLVRAVSEYDHRAGILA